MPTETDDNSKSLLFVELGRQVMCFWTILRSTNYQNSGQRHENERTILFWSVSNGKDIYQI
jgi:hypothetical protein